MQPTHYRIAKEGWIIISISVGFSLLLQWYLGKWASPIWLVTLLVVYFFRDPVRSIPHQTDAVLSPANGRIIAIEKTTDPYQKKAALKISIFMSIVNIHANYLPVAGTVRQVQYYPGKFFNASLDKASQHNERNVVIIDMKNGPSVTVVQIAGLIARRILCYIKAGDTITQAQRYGFIRFGSRIEIYLPIHTKPQVTIGDTVYNVQTILARL